MLDMPALPAVITENMEAIRALCAQHGVKRLAVFGSAVKGTFDPARSDVDFVVEFLPDQKPVHLAWGKLALADDLEKLLERDVDLVRRSTIRNPYFLQVLDLSEYSLYDAA